MPAQASSAVYAAVSVVKHFSFGETQQRGAASVNASFILFLPAFLMFLWRPSFRNDVAFVKSRYGLIAIKPHSDGNSVSADAQDDADFTNETRAALRAEPAQAKPSTGR
jgi:hypothetical protein